eukprot:scaffold481_cov208-Cylindrotheca_fusiformis.AAC.3
MADNDDNNNDNNDDDNSHSQMTFDDDELVVNYHDAVVYGSDLKLVQCPTAWLNDSCIHFYMNVLQHEDNDSNFLFMDPSVVSFFMHQCCDEEDLEDFRTNTKLPTKGGGKIFIPVNDTMRTDANWMVPGGGTHWSLLLIVRVGGGGEGSKPTESSNSNTTMPMTTNFWHFDSVQNSGNIHAAQDIAQNAATTTTLADYEQALREFSKPFCRGLRQAIAVDMLRLGLKARKK